jgi:hypothetical protein
VGISFKDDVTIILLLDVSFLFPSNLSWLTSHSRIAFCLLSITSIQMQELILLKVLLQSCSEWFAGVENALALPGI